jgi:hypothetical protein
MRRPRASRGVMVVMVNAGILRTAAHSRHHFWSVSWPSMIADEKTEDEIFELWSRIETANLRMGASPDPQRTSHQFCLRLLSYCPPSTLDEGHTDCINWWEYE